ncbi:MAG: beta-L-arabinofuranosidase domain-containing protein [Acidimicrobiales bacterium]|jgi:DUF1680 family protein
MADPGNGPLDVTLTDGFWAPRLDQLRDHTLPVLLERLEAHGVVDNLRRLSGPSTAGHRGLWFTDSDLYKWMEAAAWARRADLLDPIIEVVAGAAHADGYLHSFYDSGPGSQPRYLDLGSSHEWYCGGHLIEAALAHHETTGSDALLDPARRWADHLCATFGPGLDERVDAHPEVELALARLADRTGEERYLALSRWIIETQLDRAGLTLETVDLAGHAVKALYLASALAEVALCGAAPGYAEAAGRLFATMVEQRSYPTGAVGGRWLDESVGKPYELPAATAYAESCAAVAATQFCQRIWRLAGDPRSLEQAELLLYNAVPCGTGADGESWFYSQPHAVAEVAPESNPWAQPTEYQQQMLLQWFPARRHRWFDVTCCPTNLARIVASVDRYVGELTGRGDLLVHLPLAARLTGGGWDVEVASGYPEDGRVRLTVHTAPEGAQVSVRVPGWAGGSGHVPVDPIRGLDLPIVPQWWETDHRVEGAGSTVFLRFGPVVHCVEGVDLPGVDLRSLVVDPTEPMDRAFAIRPSPPSGSLHVPVDDDPPEPPTTTAVMTTPYHAWANRGPTTMQLRFPRR